MKTYTITRNGEKIGAVYGDSMRGAAIEFATRLAKQFAVIDTLADGTYQPGIWHPKLQRFEPIAEPFAVEGGR